MARQRKRHVYKLCEKANRDSNSHTITAYTNLWYAFYVPIDAVIVDSCFNITLNINWRTGKKLQILDSSPRKEGIFKKKVNLDNRQLLLFHKLLHSIGSKHRVMHRNTMPLSWLWQVRRTYSPLIKQTSSSHGEYGYSSTISQDLLDRGLTDFSAYNSLTKRKRRKIQEWIDVLVKSQIVYYSYHGMKTWKKMLRQKIHLDKPHSWLCCYSRSKISWMYSKLVCSKLLIQISNKVLIRWNPISKYMSLWLQPSPTPINSPKTQSNINHVKWTTLDYHNKK